MHVRAEDVSVEPQIVLSCSVGVHWDVDVGDKGGRVLERVNVRLEPLHDDGAPQVGDVEEGDEEGEEAPDADGESALVRKKVTF